MCWRSVRIYSMNCSIRLNRCSSGRRPTRRVSKIITLTFRLDTGSCEVYASSCRLYRVSGLICYLAILLPVLDLTASSCLRVDSGSWKLSLDTVENVIKTCQMVVQGMWSNKSVFLQLPHVNEDITRHFVTKRVPMTSTFLDFWLIACFYVNWGIEWLVHWVITFLVYWWRL